MKFKVLSIKLKITYKLAKFTNNLSTWFCNKHTELYNEWKWEFHKKIFKIKQ